MPSLGFHIAIARKYLKKYDDIEDEMAFIEGNLDPDLADDRIAAHYSERKPGDSLEKVLRNKVQLDRYLKDREVNSDYEKGYFLHLLADFRFFNEFIDMDYVRTAKRGEFRKDLYYTYDVVHAYLAKNYDIDYGPFADAVNARIVASQAEAGYDGSERTKILSDEKVDEFIEGILEKSVNEHLRDLLQVKA